LFSEYAVTTEINFAKRVKKSYNGRMKKKNMIEYFNELETEEEYDGYYYSVGEAITLVILGSICGLRNVRRIWMWATRDKIKGFLKEKFQINRIPCYYWLLCINVIKFDLLSDSLIGGLINI